MPVLSLQMKLWPLSVLFLVGLGACYMDQSLDVMGHFLYCKIMSCYEFSTRKKNVQVFDVNYFKDMGQDTSLVTGFLHAWSLPETELVWIRVARSSMKQLAKFGIQYGRENAKCKMKMLYKHSNLLKNHEYALE